MIEGKRMTNIKILKNPDSPLVQYQEKFGHPPSPEEFRDEGLLEMERKAGVALKRGRQVQSC